MSPQPEIKVSVHVSYLEQQSIPDQEHYLFAYTITIKNQGSETARLLTRHWEITNGNGQLSTVSGPGVVGKQPYLNPGEEFTYTSSTAIDTAVGAMQGHYSFQSESGTLFDVPIPTFRLARPGALH